jgi:hypothetical protein
MTIALSIFLKELKEPCGANTTSPTCWSKPSRLPFPSMTTQGRDSAGDQVDLPRAGVAVRLADTSGLQGEQHDAGLLTIEYRKPVLVRLLERPAVKRGGGLTRHPHLRCHLRYRQAITDHGLIPLLGHAQLPHQGSVMDQPKPLSSINRNTVAHQPKAIRHASTDLIHKTLRPRQESNLRPTA